MIQVTTLQGRKFFVDAWGSTMTSRHAYTPEHWMVVEDKGATCMIAEIQDGKMGSAVLNRDAVIKTNTGQDVTDEFIIGAQKSLALAQNHHIRVAILKAKSPSCGSNVIYDGTFSRKLIPSMGVTATLLNQHDILVFDEDHIDEALDVSEGL